MSMLTINNLHVSVNNKPILKDLTLEVNRGEVHAIMGPNASGKSTLAYVLAGHEGYTVESGEIWFNGINLMELSPEERARKGIFLAFQYPVEIPGVNNVYFMKAAVNVMRKQRGLDELDAIDFMQLAKEKMQALDMNDSMLKRAVNEGFSGGEKKRNEIFQMTMLEPTLALLDETDSGLDIDALKIVAQGVNALRDKQRSFIVITHYQRLLNYIIPDYVHVLSNGKIVRSGDRTLALDLEKQGYAWLQGEEVSA